MRAFKFITVCCLATSVLAGCQSSRINQGPVTPQPALTPAEPVASVDGKWIPVEPENRKIYYNEFKNGKFATYSPDGQTTLALGKYTKNATGADVSYFSETRKRQVNATCALLDADRMRCTVGGSIANLQRA